MRKWTFMFGVIIVASGSVNAQTVSRKANIVSGGNPNSGRCTVEVAVDGSAEVEIRGDNATLRNTGGQAPQWRRFECTGAMPANPSNFRFAGVDGRGSQNLVRGPGNNGGALVRIADSDAGVGNYTFDVSWGNGGGQDGGPQYDNRNRQSGQFQGPDDRNRQGGQFQGPDDRNRQGGQFQGPDDRSNRGDYRGEQRFTQDQTVRVCQDAIRDRAASRFGIQNIDFRSISADNNPGRQDWVSGELAIRRRFGRQDVYRFSCSVDFRTGQVRTAQIDQFERNSYPQGQ
ncbi:MAG: hypothetical protein JWO19_1334, partial [Bryobacterales bacterium]|nr:hypothetical protein [Bryobacterales bacterium]